jgi:hypothetical protein
VPESEQGAVGASFEEGNCFRTRMPNKGEYRPDKDDQPLTRKS